MVKDRSMVSAHDISRMPPQELGYLWFPVLRFFVYRDNGQPNSPILFEVAAQNITEADEAFQRTTGRNITTAIVVSCPHWLNPLKNILRD